MKVGSAAWSTWRDDETASETSAPGGIGWNVPSSRDASAFQYQMPVLRSNAKFHRSSFLKPASEPSWFQSGSACAAPLKNAETRCPARSERSSSTAPNSARSAMRCSSASFASKPRVLSASGVFTSQPHSDAADSRMSQHATSAGSTPSISW